MQASKQLHGSRRPLWTVRWTHKVVEDEILPHRRWNRQQARADSGLAPLVT